MLRELWHFPSARMSKGRGCCAAEAKLFPTTVVIAGGGNGRMELWSRGDGSTQLGRFGGFECLEWYLSNISVYDVKYVNNLVFGATQVNPPLSFYGLQCFSKIYDTFLEVF